MEWPWARVRQATGALPADAAAPPPPLRDIRARGPGPGGRGPKTARIIDPTVPAVALSFVIPLYKSAETIASVVRDIEALEASGFPVERISNPEDPQAGDRFRIESSVKVARHLTLSARELFALYMTRGMLTPLRESALYADLEKVFSQIDALIPKSGREHIDELSAEVGFEPGPRWGLGVTTEILDTILAACSNSQVLEMDYQSTASTERRSVSTPSRLEASSGK